MAFLIAVPLPEHTDNIARAIQLAVGPVFLITGVASFLGTTTGRLARITDRARTLERSWDAASTTERSLVETELRSLSRRVVLTNQAITLTAVSLLLIGLLVSVLFLGAFLERQFIWAAAALFLAALLALVGAVGRFLQEVFLATQSVNIGMRILQRSAEQRTGP